MDVRAVHRLGHVGFALLLVDYGRVVIVLPDARDAVLVKQVRLGRGGFILTVVPPGDDRPEAERLVTLTAGIRLHKTSPLPDGFQGAAFASGNWPAG